MKDLHALALEYHARCCELGQFNRIRRNTLWFYLRSFVEWLAGQVQVVRPDQLSSEIMFAWHLHVSGRPCRRTGLPQQPASVHTEIMVIRRFCQWLHKDGYVPAALVQGFSSLRPPAIRQQIALRHDEARHYLQSLPMNTPGDFLFRALAEFLYSSGARAEETLQLDVAHLDLAEGKARVMGKGRKERMVPIGRTATRHLEIYLVGVRPLCLRDPKEPALWLNQSGRRLKYTSLRVWFAQRDRPGEGRRIRPHILRRSCATEMLRGGASMWAVKELLGHDDLHTLEHYALFDLTDLKEMHTRCHPRDLAAPATLEIATQL